ncbi:MAG: FapA family protein [Spirochaetales bacterium]|nr:FapA family protein [Spirochaetales bacterium]
MKRGEPLAKRVPAADGENGRNVLGEVLLAGEKDVVTYRPGQNTLEKDGILYASCHGRFEVQEKNLVVFERLEIPGNVDYTTGHIAFPGDVVIHGEVRDGFRVSSGKSISVKGTMDATQVLARENLVVEGGIKGRKDALIRVGGDLHARFIENSAVESHGKIFIEKAALNTHLRALGSVQFGDGGALIGGSAWSRESLQFVNVGRPGAPASEIRAGIDVQVHRQLGNLQRQIERLEMRIDGLRNRPHINSAQEELVLRGEEALARMHEHEKVLHEQLHPEGSVHIAVKGRIVEGSIIMIGPHSLVLDQNLEKCLFEVKPGSERIQHSSLSSSQSTIQSVPASSAD